MKHWSARVAAGSIFLAMPFIAFAFPFGGQAYSVIRCYNDAILAKIGPPVAGWYVWTPATATFQFGAPTHSGQWLLGLAGAPYYCLESIEPIIVETGINITMLGTSQ